MDLQEKKNLLSAIKQSASPGHADTAHVKSVRMFTTLCFITYLFYNFGASDGGYDRP